DEQRLYTEQEVFQLLQIFREEQRTISQQTREERELPVETLASLETSSAKQIQDGFKRYK
ncbi:hypothetical protein EDC96DRAFT_428164, partial [Choanephora cucurbitarum]